MTHFLEDRVPLVDIWPEEVAVGRYFCERKIHDQTVITLPRASEIDCALERGGSARTGYTTKVAVIWNWTGRSKTQLRRCLRVV
jgi:hypothetical protein